MSYLRRVEIVLHVVGWRTLQASCSARDLRRFDITLHIFSETH